MVKELVDMLSENWARIVPACAWIYGIFRASSGMYETVKTNSNAGVGDIIIGTCIIGLSGIAFPILYKLSEHLQQ